MTEMLILGGAFVICILLTWAVGRIDNFDKDDNDYR